MPVFYAVQVAFEAIWNCFTNTDSLMEVFTVANFHALIAECTHAPHKIPLSDWIGGVINSLLSLVDY